MVSTSGQYYLVVLGKKDEWRIELARAGWRVSHDCDGFPDDMTRSNQADGLILDREGRKNLESNGDSKRLTSSVHAASEKCQRRATGQEKTSRPEPLDSLSDSLYLLLSP